MNNKLPIIYLRNSQSANDIEQLNKIDSFVRSHHRILKYLSSGLTSLKQLQTTQRLDLVKLKKYFEYVFR